MHTQQSNNYYAEKISINVVVKKVHVRYLIS